MIPPHDSSSPLEQLGWRQCSVIEGRAVPGLDGIVSDYADDDVFIVLPYSCAVVQMDFEKEPNIELFRVKRVDRRDRGLQYGRSPRLLQLEMEEDEETIYVNGSIHDRYLIEHHLFLDIHPSTRIRLCSDQCIVVKNWFAKRYIRNAFPTEFNKRANSALKELQKRLKGNLDTDDLLGVYMDIDPYDQELEEVDEVYEVEVVFLVKEPGRTSEPLNEIKEKFNKTLSECNGILVSGVSIRSETDMLLSEYRRVVRIDDYDFISFRYNQDGTDFI